MIVNGIFLGAAAIVYPRITRLLLTRTQIWSNAHHAQVMENMKTSLIAATT
jgi:hypothetical protein